MVGVHSNDGKLLSLKCLLLQSMQVVRLHNSATLMKCADMGRRALRIQPFWYNEFSLWKHPPTLCKGHEKNAYCFNNRKIQMPCCQRTVVWMFLHLPQYAREVLYLGQSDEIGTILYETPFYETCPSDSIMCFRKYVMCFHKCVHMLRVENVL